MNKSVLDLIPILQLIEAVLQSSSLTEAQRQVIIAEMSGSIPDPILCPTSRMTLSIIKTIMEKNNGSTKSAPSQDASEAKEPKQIKGAKRKPSSSAASNPRGSRKAQTNVGQSKE